MNFEKLVTEIVKKLGACSCECIGVFVALIVEVEQLEGLVVLIDGW